MTVEHEAVGAGVHLDHLAVVVVALEQLARDRVRDLPLDHPLERTGAEVGVVADAGDVLARSVRELETETTCLQAAMKVSGEVLPLPQGYQLPFISCAKRIITVLPQFFATWADSRR